MKEFQKFSIDYIVKKDLGDTVQKWFTPQGYDITCPFCDGKRKFNVNVSKDVARCNKCGASFNALTLHASLTNQSNASAYKDLLLGWVLSPNENRVEMQSTEEQELLKNFSKDFPWIVSEYNKRLIDALTLSPKHKEDLIKRGLSEEQIEKGGYKSYPKTNLGDCCYQVLVEPSISRYNVFFKKKDYRIPGFYDMKTGKPKMVKRSDGFLIPVKTLEQYISCFQIRYDDLPENATLRQREYYHKYAWFSSAEKKTGIGVTGVQTINHAGFDTVVNGQVFDFPTYRTVNLTEGILKSDIAAALSGRPFIGLPGVNCISQLQSCLERLKVLCGTKNINICIDMDYREKREVASALENIVAIVQGAGLNCRVVCWDSRYKGIDDFLNAQKETSGFALPLDI